MFSCCIVPEVRRGNLLFWFIRTYFLMALGPLLVKNIEEVYYDLITFNHFDFIDN